jgi:TolB-like protein
VKLEDVISKALEKDRKLRYQSASDLSADLQRVQRDIGSSQLGSGAAARGPAAVRPARRAMAFAATIAVAALFAGATWFWWARTPGPAIDAIAVLPFVNESGNPDIEYLSDGITEALINNLSRLRTLRVSARSTVFRYKDRGADPRTVGSELGVRAVVAGRLLQRDNRVIVRAELIDVSNGSQLWGDELTRAWADLFALQGDLAAEIAGKLRLEVTPEERQRLTKRDTQDTAAYDLYLRGRHHWNKRSGPDGQKAIDYFSQAIARDPQYALAYVGLADAYNLASFFNAFPPRQVMPKATAAAAKALELDEQLAAAHISLAYASFTYDWNWTAATRHFERARALNAFVAETHPYYPFYLTVARRPADAIQAAERALDLDPRSASLSHSRAVQLVLARRYDAAIEECRRTIALDSAYAIAYEVMAVAYSAKQMYGEALPLIETAVRLGPDNPMSLGILGYVRANLNQDHEARRILEQLARLAQQRYIPAQAFAVVHVGLDEKDRAFAWLDKAVEERSNRLAYLGLEPTWDRLHGDSRFAELIRRIGLPQ